MRFQSGTAASSRRAAHYCECDFWPRNTALCVTDSFGNHPLFCYTCRSRLTSVVTTRAPEQTAIAAVLSDMDAEIAASEAKLAKARQVN